MWLTKVQQVKLASWLEAYVFDECVRSKNCEHVYLARWLEAYVFCECVRSKNCGSQKFSKCSLPAG